jgi:hypothetical protein
LLCSRKAAAVVATAFTLKAIPITTSAVAATALVAGTPADILADSVVAGAAPGFFAAADKVTAAVRRGGLTVRRRYLTASKSGLSMSRSSLENRGV